MGPARKVTLREVRRRAFEFAAVIYILQRVVPAPLFITATQKVLGTKTDVDQWSVAAPCVMDKVSLATVFHTEICARTFF